MNIVRPEHAPLLVRLSQLLGSSLEIQQVLETLIDEILAQTGAERGFIVARPPDSGEQADWHFRTARALDPSTLDTDEFRVSRGIINQVAETGRSLMTDDAAGDSRFRQQASVHLYNLRAILCVPLLVSQRVIGVIYVDHLVASGAFNRETQALLESIAGPAAIAVENALLYDQLRRVYESSLQAARQELAQTQAQLLHTSKMAAVGQLAAGVAHEVNNPLGAIQLNLSGMLTFSDDAKFQRRIEVSLRALDRCRGVIARLLTFAHPGERPRRLCELEPILHTALDLVDPDLRQHRITVERHFQSGLEIELVDDDLSQVIFNLVLNARDSLKNSPGGQMRVVTRSSPTHCEIRVSDNGPGVPAEVRERIFEPFFTTKPVGQGVGLGLSICYQLVQRNGGTLALESGRGGPRSASIFRWIDSMSERILVVEDDEFMRESLETELLDAGYEVTVVGDGREAIELARRNHYDLVVCDIRMPGMGGLETISSLKEQLPVMRSIVITGYASPDTPILAVKMNVDDYLMKPFSSEQFLASVRQSLDRYVAELRKNKAVARLRSTVADLIEFVQSHPREDRITQACLRLCHALRFSLLRSKSVQLASRLLGMDRAALEPIEELRDLGLFVELMEERWDGTGSRGLKAEQIPLESRILAAARAYQNCLHAQEFPQGLRARAGAELEPRLVELLVQDGEEQPNPPSPLAGESLLNLAESYWQSGHGGLAQQALFDVSPEGLSSEAKLRHRRLVLAPIIEGKDPLAALVGAREFVHYCRGGGHDLAAAHATLTWAKLAPGGDVGLVEALRQACQTFSLWESFPALTHALLSLVGLEGEQALADLIEAVRRFETFSVLEAASPPLVAVLGTMLGSPELAACWIQSGPPAVSLLRRIHENGEAPVRSRALELLSNMPDKEARDLLAQIGSQKSGSGFAAIRTAPAQPTRVQLLGRLRWFCQGKPICDEEFPTRKARSLFAYLCFHRGQPLEENALADVFWPHLPKAGHSLQNAVSQVRSLLQRYLGPSGRDLLVKKRSGYHFFPSDSMWIDLEEFQAARKRGLDLLGRQAGSEALSELKRAESLYSGEFLQDLTEDWTETYRVTLTGQLQNILIALGGYFFARKKYAVSMEYWRKILQQDECSEDACHGLMLCQIALERSGDAAKSYHQCARKMREELNLSPSPRLSEFYLRLTSGQAIDLVLPPFY